MCKTLFSFILCTFILLSPVVSLGQIPDEEGFGVEQMEMGQEEEEGPGKVVESKIGIWNLSAYAAFQDSTYLDTLHDYSHFYHPVYKNTITATFPGNYGNPALDNNFINRNYKGRYFLAQSREAYILSHSELDYYNTTTPYTRMDFSQSENKSKNNETRFNVIHTQNINPFWNFTFRTNQEKSDGQYNNQESKNNFVTLYTNYTRDNWNVYGGFISNSIENQENGGLPSDSILYDGRDPGFWTTNLAESTTKIGNTHYFANAEYRVGKWIENEDETETFIPVMGFIYSFNYDRNKHQFYEEESDDNTFFANTYYGNEYVKDSVRFNVLSNVIQLKQYESQEKKFTFGKRAFLGHELVRGSMPGEYVISQYQRGYPYNIFGPDLNGWNPNRVVQRTDIAYSNLFIGGGIFRQSGDFWTWNFDGKLYLTGRNAGGFEINGDIAKPFTFWGDTTAFVRFKGAIQNNMPDYFQENYYSNHVRWKNNLEAEQRMVVGGEFQMPGRRFKLGANYAIINNYFYNDTLGIPKQTGDEILVLSAYIDKDFSFRNLHLRTHVLWQKSSNEKVIHIPDLSALVSAYYQFTISKVLFTQLGADVRYNTKYYADAYSPATGLFYLQNEMQYGNYPYIDVYASLRLKRTRVFFKWMNIGTNFLDGVYMTTPSYPMNRATFRLGVSWAFYD